ncbi:MAG: hypothetical protein ACRCZ9_12105 [Fusobacteriaceae bacterium]
MKISCKKERELEYLSGRTNTVPFANQVSCNRHLLYASAEKHCVPLNRGEIPIVSTIHLKDCSRSSDNYVAETDMYVINVIRKKIRGVETSEATIFFERHLPDGSYIIDVCEHNDRINTAVDSFSVGIVNTMLDKSYIPKGEMYIKTSSYSESGIYKRGVNLNSIYLACETTLEDAIDIFPSGEKKLTTVKKYMFKTKVDGSVLLKNLYGDKETYQPIPLIGECVKGDYLISISPDSSDVSFIKFNDSVNTRSRSDRSGIYPEGSKVINITARLPRETYTPNRFLMGLVLDQRAYEDEVYAEVVNLRDHAYNSGKYVSKEFMDIQLELNAIINENTKYRYKEDIVPENSVILEIELEKESKVQLGQKLSGLHGNKGVVSKLRKEQAYDENGDTIDIIVNQAGVINRSNPGQLTEKSIGGMGKDLARHVIKNPGVNVSELVLDFMKIIGDDMYDIYKRVFDNYNYSEFYSEIEKDKCFHFCLPAWSHGVNLKTIILLEDLLHNNGVNIGRKKVNIDGSWLPGAYDVGPQYFVRLQQSVESKVNIRSKGEIGSKGNVAKNFEKKLGLVKYQNTPIKISEYITDILQNSLNAEQSKAFMKNETSVIESLDALTRATGFQITGKIDPYSDDNTDVDNTKD